MQERETEPVVPTKHIVVEQVAPKQLPAKGQSSSEVVPPPDSERS
jgi:hypothetical protein